MKSNLTKPECRGFASLERRDLTKEETEAGYIGVLRGSVPFNADSQVMSRRSSGGRVINFVERIDPGAFARSLKEDRDIVATAGHAEDPLSAFAILGENLTITTTERSMDWEAKVPDTTAGRDLMRLVDMKIIRGTSFEFVLRENGDKWEKRGEDMQVRTITDARLFEVNPVKWPAYLGTTLTVEMRGRYLNDSGIVDWYDPTITAPTKFAQSVIYRLMDALENALEYLRAEPTGPLADIAARQVTQCGADIAELATWLAANGADVNVAGMAALSLRSIEEFRKESRQVSGDDTEKNSVSHWERRLALISKDPTA